MTTYEYTYTTTDSDGGPALVDFDFWRGSNLPPVIWGPEMENGAPFPAAGSRFILTISWDGGLIRKDTEVEADAFVLDERTSELTWTPTLAESRSIPIGPVAQYEIERRIGSFQEPFITGIINGKGGINDD